jgi:cell wall-associated NlpC family hydrolase
MDTQTFREAFVEWVLRQEGKPYCWPHEFNGYSGKDLPGCKYPGTFDCSGLMTNGLYHASAGRLDHRAMWNAQKLHDMLKHIERSEAQVGDLVFYGHGSNMISHVMMVAPEGKVFGACGGTHLTINPTIAHTLGARVRFRPSPDYRADLISFGLLPD